MKISIITPVLNDKRISHALDSILSQNHNHQLELVVVDGGSTDGTLDVLKQYGDRIDIQISQPDQGIYDGMNKGISRCTGEVVGILNADDRYHDSLVLRDVAEAMGDSCIEACYGDLVYVNSHQEIIRHWRSGQSNRLKWCLGWMPPHPTLFVRKSVYEKYGHFDIGYTIAADYELMLRLFLKHKMRTVYLKRLIVRMAIGGTSNSSVSKVLRANRQVARAWHRNKLHGGILVPVLKPAQKVFQFRRLSHASILSNGHYES